MAIRVIILWGAAMLGALPVQSFKQLYHKKIKYILAFSGGMLLTILCARLLPFIFINAPSAQHAGIFLLLGFALQIFIEHLTMGAEHGHIHRHPHSWKQELWLVIGMSLHSITDGIPLSLDTTKFDVESYLGAIALHKVPEGFVLMMLFSTMFGKGAKPWIAMAIYASLSPLAMVMASQFAVAYWMPYVIALVSGGLFHVSTTILFENNPDADHHRFNPYKWIAIVAGGLTALVL